MYWDFFSFVLGTVFGSFFLLVSDRSCQKEYQKRTASLLLAPSHCEYCNARLGPLDLIPVLSFIRNRMRCRHCGSQLSIRYPVFEIVSGIIAMSVYNYSGFTVLSITFYFILMIAISISYTDIRSMRIPDLLLIFLAITVVVRLFVGFSRENIYGFLFLGGLFLIILFIFPGAFGGGDVKYGALIGLCCGFPLSVVVLEIALISGSLFGIAYALISGRGMRIKIPFGPFLSLGFIASLLYGSEILMLYHGFFF